MPTNKPPKDKAAQRLGRKGWKGLKEAKGAEEVRSHMSQLAQKRWANARAAASRKTSKPSTTGASAPPATS